MKLPAILRVLLVVSFGASCAKVQRQEGRVERRKEPDVILPSTPQSSEEARYAAKELECSQYRSDAEFLRANDRNPSVVETKAKACYEEVADYKEAKLHKAAMFNTIGDGSATLRFKMEAVRSESDLDIFWAYRAADGGMKKEGAGPNLERYLAESDRAADQWKRAKTQGRVRVFAKDTTVSNLTSRHIINRFGRREVVFTFVHTDDTFMVPSWADSGQQAQHQLHARLHGRQAA